MLPQHLYDLSSCGDKSAVCMVTGNTATSLVSTTDPMTFIYEGMEIKMKMIRGKLNFKRPSLYCFVVSQTVRPEAEVVFKCTYVYRTNNTHLRLVYCSVSLFSYIIVLFLLARRSLAGGRNGTEWKEQNCHSC